jgi:hypothetical protein
VDINAALIGIYPGALVDSLFQTFQSQNTGQYQIILGRTLIPVNARILAFFENAPHRSAVSDFLFDSMDTEGCFERVLSNAIAKTGGRGVVSLDNGLLLTDKEGLCLNRLDEEKFCRVGEEFP